VCFHALRKFFLFLDFAWEKMARLFRSAPLDHGYLRHLPSTLVFQNSEFQFQGLLVDTVDPKRAPLEMPRNVWIRDPQRGIVFIGNFEPLEEGYVVGLKKNGMAFKNPKIKGFYQELLKVFKIKDDEQEQNNHLRWFPCFYNKDKQQILSVSEILQAMAVQKKVLSKLIQMEDSGNVDSWNQKFGGSIAFYKGVYPEDKVEVATEKKIKKNVDRHSPRPPPNICHLPKHPRFSLLSTFKGR
jgi:hypothetical protein